MASLSLPSAGADATNLILSLQAFSVENAAERAETAEKMIRKLRAGMMPPRGIPRPAGDTLLALVETLESEVDRAAAAAPALGERLFQRLSQGLDTSSTVSSPSGATPLRSSHLP